MLLEMLQIKSVTTQICFHPFKEDVMLLQKSTVERDMNQNNHVSISQFVILLIEIKMFIAHRYQFKSQVNFVN